MGPIPHSVRKETSTMIPFMNEDFLLSNDTAKVLYHNYAKEMPIIDYHCHINPQEIAEDRKFENITQVWLGGDHYKWRQMRSNGIEEKYITGDASDYEKFLAWAATLQKAIGNPLYHWSHLELQRYFGYKGTLSPATAKEVWDICNKKLAEAGFSARNLIKMSNVSILCTTDDPADSLCWHKMIAEDPSFDVRVLPAWRPDRAMSPEKPDYIDYIATLSHVSGITIQTYDDLKAALCNRLDFFASMGCKISDHGLGSVLYAPASEEEVAAIFKKRLAGNRLSEEELDKFKYAFLLFMGKEYHRLDWAMQLHYGVRRDNNTRIYNAIGPDTGFDCINSVNCSEALAAFLNALAITDELPRTILYSLNPIDNAAIGTIMGCFQDSSAIGKIQHGSAWWFNDNKTGMTDQMISLANLGLLSNFIGMLTDSRSFLSYTRHEYFRRILCNLIGTWVENGEYPADIEFLGKTVQDISYNNSLTYFRF